MVEEFKLGNLVDVRRGLSLNVVLRLFFNASQQSSP